MKRFSRPENQAGIELRATAFATGLAARGVEAQRGPD